MLLKSACWAGNQGEDQRYKTITLLPKLNRSNLHIIKIRAVIAETNNKIQDKTRKGGMGQTSNSEWKQKSNTG